MNTPVTFRFLGLFLACLPAHALAQNGAALFQQQLSQPVVGQCFTVTVDLAASPGFSVERRSEGSELRYRMAFNHVTEGWSWQPDAARDAEDYYRFKYLPLGSSTEQRGSYRGEDKIGVSQQMQIVWRYDYFLAFDNLYDFYAPEVDDEAGFVAQLKTAQPGEVAMRADACLIAPVTSESTTFWKATYGKPTDFTLKKRYLVARLQAIEFFDQGSGQPLAILKPPDKTPAR
jgi:hypothetical protein